MEIKAIKGKLVFTIEVDYTNELDRQVLLRKLRHATKHSLTKFKPHAECTDIVDGKNALINMNENDDGYSSCSEYIDWKSTTPHVTEKKKLTMPITPVADTSDIDLKHDQSSCNMRDFIRLIDHKNVGAMMRTRHDKKECLIIHAKDATSISLRYAKQMNKTCSNCVFYDVCNDPDCKYVGVFAYSSKCILPLNWISQDIDNERFWKLYADSRYGFAFEKSSIEHECCSVYDFRYNKKYGIDEFIKTSNLAELSKMCLDDDVAFDIITQTPTHYKL